MIAGKMSTAPNTGEGIENTHDPIARERDQLAMVLRVSQAAASLDLNELIEQVANCFQTSPWRWDFTSVFLHEPAERALRQHSLFANPAVLSDPKKYNGALIPIDGSQSGKAFLTGEPHVANTRAEYEASISPAFASVAMKVIPASYSCCVVPLVCRGRRFTTRMKTAVGSDHAGFALKQELAQTVRAAGHELVDVADYHIGRRRRLPRLHRDGGQRGAGRARRPRRVDLR